MKKMLFTALVAACAMTACGTKTTETAAEEEVAREAISLMCRSKPYWHNATFS